MTATLRQAVRADISEIQRARHPVREDRLTSAVVTDQDVIAAIERTGNECGALPNGELLFDRHAPKTGMRFIVHRVPTEFLPQAVAEN